MEVVTGTVPHHCASSTGLSPSQRAGQQVLGQWGAWMSHTRFNLMGTYCVRGLSQALERPILSSPWELIINGGRQTGC